MIESVECLGRPAVRLRAPDGAEATVLLHGAHIVSWIPAGGQEQLYLSPRAVAGSGQAVRGGIPVIFPQFAARGPLPRHGLVRTRDWQWAESHERDGHATGVLRFTDSDEIRALWPHAFEAELCLSVGSATLEVELAVLNTGDAPFAFSAALHTYLLCGELGRTRLAGLHGVRYHDALTGQERRQEIDPQGFTGEVDRIYFDAPAPLALSSPLGRVRIEADGFPDVVVWNPGPAQAAALADLPDEDWARMLCVESAAIGHPPTVQPGQDWVARVTISA